MALVFVDFQLRVPRLRIRVLQRDDPREPMGTYYVLPDGVRQAPGAPRASDAPAAVSRSLPDSA